MTTKIRNKFENETGNNVGLALEGMAGHALRYIDWLEDRLEFQNNRTKDAVSKILWELKQNNLDSAKDLCKHFIYIEWI